MALRLPRRRLRKRKESKPIDSDPDLINPERKKWILYAGEQADPRVVDSAAQLTDHNHITMAPRFPAEAMSLLEATEHGGSAYVEEVHAVTLDLIGNRTTAADHEIAALEQQQPGNIINPRADSRDRVDDDAELQHHHNAVHDPAALSSIPEDGPVLAHVPELPRDAMNPAADSAQLGESEEAVASEAARQIEQRVYEFPTKLPSLKSHSLQILFRAIVGYGWTWILRPTMHS